MPAVSVATSPPAAIPAPASRNAPRLISVQFLRGIAAVSVLFGHAQTEFNHGWPAFHKIGFEWDIGVDLFFCISGFIMMITNYDHFAGRGAPKRFITRRLVRIVPIYWFFTIAMVAAMLLVPGQIGRKAGGFGIVQILTSLAFVPWRGTDGLFLPVLTLGWTLNYEMFFYALFALALSQTRTKGMGVLLTTLVALALLGHAVDFGASPLAFWTGSIILEFAMGVAIGFAYKAIRTRIGLPGFCTGLVIAALAYGFVANTNLPRFVALGVPAALLFATIVFFESGAFDRAVTPIGEWLGESSYSLYLSHPFSIGLVKLAWPGALAGTLTGWLFVSTSVVCAVAGGIVAYLVVERPALLALHERLARRREPHPQLVS